jgi:cobalt/nickel transport system permease protein
LQDLASNSLLANQRRTEIKVQQENHHHGHDVGERLYLHQHSLVHSLPSHLKIIAALAFILIVVSTPVTQWPAFIAYFVWLLTVVLIAKIPVSLLFKRSLIEIPFVFFAILMPFFGSGEKVQVGPFDLYREGLIAGSGIVVKGTLGVMTAIILSTSTTAREILRGLERLKLPMLIVQIASFMLRYVNVVNDEMERMKVARESRGFQATGIKSWKVLATAAGALFIRSYERGERVHLSMLSRGYEGVLPQEHQYKINGSTWLAAMVYPLVAALIFVAQLLIGKM